MELKYVVRLSKEERQSLFEVINGVKGGKEKRNRAHILLKADCGDEGENWKDDKIAEALVKNGFEETINRKLPSKKKKRIIEGEEEAHLIAIACSDPPQGRSSWTLRILADKMVELSYVDSVSHETIRRALKKTNLSLG